MANTLEVEFADVEVWLRELYGGRPNAHFLEARVFSIATHRSIDPPKARSRPAYLEWLRINGSVAREELSSMNQT
jgi:hypothetical protein